MTAPLVMFGEDWGGLPSSTQHLAKRFAKSRPVIWVNSIGLRRPRLDRRDMARAWRKLSRMTPSSNLSTSANGAIGGHGATDPNLPENLTVVHPRAVPWPGNPLARFANRRILGRQIRDALRARGLAEPVLWTSLPTAVDLVGALRERAVVYYCCDDFESLAGVDHGPVGRLERELVGHADLVLTTSDHLARKLSPTRHESLPHGVDADLFGTPAPRPADLPEGPVALFYGSLSSWLNVDLISRLARSRADWRIVLVGREEVDLGALRAVPNVRFLGPRAHHALPGYVQHSDAAILPFRDIPQIRACNPLKLREYLASGTPVISTRFPAAEAYGDVVTIADDADAFARALDAVDRSPSARAVRRARVAAETWEARASAALAHIDGVTRC